MIAYALWLVPGAIAGVGGWRPRWAVYIFAATLPLFGSAPGGPNLAVAYVGALTMVLVAALRGQSPTVRWRWSGTVAAIWLLVGVIALMPWPRPPHVNGLDLLRLVLRLPSLHGHEPLFGWTVLSTLALGLLVAWAILRLVPRWHLPQLALAVSIGVVATVVVGLAQRFGWLDLWHLRPVPRAMDEARMQSLWVDSRRMAEYLVLAWPLTLAWSRVASRWGRRGRLLQAVVLTAALVGLVWSLQRGAWIAVAVQLFALALLDRALIRRWWKPIAAVATLVTLLVLLTPPLRRPLVERIRSTDDSSRIHYGLVAADLFRERPILGWGPGSWAWGYERKAADRGGPIRGADTAHGLLTQIAAERGVIGLAAFGLLVITLAMRGRPPTSRGSTPVRTGLGLSALGFILYGGFQYLPYLPVLEWLLWTIAAMWIIATTESQREARLATWGGAAAVAAALAVLPWQQERPWRQPPRIGLFAWEWSGVRRNSVRRTTTPTHRWTSDYVAVELPREGDWLSFSLVDGHPQAAKHPVWFALRIDGEVLLEQPVPDNWHRCRVRMPEPAGSQRKNTLLVELEVEPGFRPFRSVASSTGPPVRRRDIRHLGMVLGNTCNGALCLDDSENRLRAQRADRADSNACFPDQAPRLRRGPTPDW